MCDRFRVLGVLGVFPCLAISVFFGSWRHLVVIRRFFCCLDMVSPCNPVSLALGLPSTKFCQVFCTQESGVLVALKPEEVIFVSECGESSV